MEPVAVAINRGRVVRSAGPQPFLSRRTYIGVILHGDEKERYEKISEAKAEKVFRHWLANPNRYSPADYHLTHAELDEIVPSESTDDRLCERCGQAKSRCQFYRSKSGPGGYSPVCRQCEALPIGDEADPIGKRCGHCKKFKGFEQFYRCPTRAGGYSSWCRTCSQPRRAAPKAVRDEGVPDGLKRCSRCKQVREKRFFSRHCCMRDGLSPACIDCDRERKRRLRAGGRAGTIRKGGARHGSGKGGP